MPEARHKERLDEFVHQTTNSHLFFFSFFQGRFKEEWLDEYLRKNAIVLITGSKFFRGPPFSGAVLVPGAIMERLILTDVDMPAGLRQFLSANEVPPALADWRSALTQSDNVGLALRWVAALEEIEPFLEIPAEERDAAMVAWHNGVKEMLGQYSNTLEHMENSDCLTIMSVRLRRKKGGYLSVGESKKVFEWMTQDLTGKLDGEVAARRCYIGQPVSLTSEECVVRVAAVNIMYTYIDTHTHTYIHTCIHPAAYTRACMHAYIHSTCMHACMHTYTYKHTHTHTHIHTCVATPTCIPSKGGPPASAPGHRVSRPRGTGSVGDSVGEGHNRLSPKGHAPGARTLTQTPNSSTTPST